jgi:cholera enterotoxin subunit A
MKIFALVLCCISFSALADPPAIVYRAVIESPTVVKQTGGFLPRAADGTRPNQPPPNISLFNHTNGAATGLARIDSGYVSTTTLLSRARMWVSDHFRGEGYVYYIQPTGNFIDVNGTLRIYSPHQDELEYASLGMIRWNQVIGWQRVISSELQPYERNRDYNASLYSQSHAGEAQPQLAGFPPEHIAWTMEPWRSFAHCSGSRRDVTEQCVPDENSQNFGEDYFYKINSRFLIMKLLDLLFY